MQEDLHDLVIHDGKLIDSTQTREMDLAVDGGRISEIGHGLHGRKVINAGGKYVLPGAVDPHVHLEMPVGKTFSSDDWFTGTRAAACGGTTCVLDFVEPQPNQSLAEALEDRKELALGKAAIDFSLHMTITNDELRTLHEISSLAAEGCTSFKTYLTYEGFHLMDTAFLKVLCTVKETGGIVLVHAENDTIISHLQAKYRQADRSVPGLHAFSRPPIAEAEAIGRSLALAMTAGARLYVVHTSTSMGMEAIRAARLRGVNAYGETCPQYLLLTKRKLSLPGFEGAKFVCSPPLRTHRDNERLWKALAQDDLQTIGTDHCPFFFKGQKDLGQDDFLSIPGGLPGIEARLALIHQFGVRMGRITLNRWVELCCANPARIFGLYPRKGSLEPGADADLVLFDPEKKVTLSTAVLHEHVDYTPYEGFKLRGYPVTTLLRGKIIYENGEFCGESGAGQYLHRQVGIS